jgi:hypothetical protein
MLALLIFVVTAQAMTPPRNARPPPPADAGTVKPAELSADEVHERIEMYLGSFERPVTPAMWQRLGPAAIPELEKIVRDPQQLPSRRASALNGIAAIGSLTAPDLVLELARDEKQPTTVRIAAIGGVGRLVPKERAVQELQPILKNAASGQVRRSAAEVLAAHGSCDAVRAQAKREQQPGRMAKALKVCDQKQ